MNQEINELTINGKTYVEKSNSNATDVQPITALCLGTPFRVGADYLVRTITMIYTGKLIRVYDRELVLNNCAWIADTGRWQQAVANGSFNEVEPYPSGRDVIINREAILDMCIIKFELPTKQK